VSLQAKRSNLLQAHEGLLRRFAPRNDSEEVGRFVRWYEESLLSFVMPAKAGTQASGKVLAFLGSRFRGNDDVGGWLGFLP
jgi:hypothetical protein